MSLTNLSLRSKLRDTYVITSLVVSLLLLASVVTWHAGHTISKSSSGSVKIAKSSSSSSKVLTGAQTPTALKNQASASPKTTAASGKIAVSTRQEQVVSRATDEVNQAVSAKRFSPQQGQMVIAKLADIQKYEQNLPANPTPQQRQNLIKQEISWRQWALQNHIPYHYIDIAIN